MCDSRVLSHTLSFLLLAHLKYFGRVDGLPGRVVVGEGRGGGGRGRALCWGVEVEGGRGFRKKGKKGAGLPRARPSPPPLLSFLFAPNNPTWRVLAAPAVA